MALYPFGILPAATAGGNELAAVTRRAVMPGVVVQIGKATVAVSSMLSAAEPVSGGVSPITIPVQGTRMVAGAWTGYSGGFAAPQVLPGLQNAEYNLAAFVVPIPYYLFEGMAQQDAEIVPIVWARMNDAGNYTSDALASALYAAQSANTALMPFSLNDVISTTDPTQGNLGNIASSNAWWTANVAAISTINPASDAWSRNNVIAAVTAASAGSGGEKPSCGIVSPGAWMAIASDVIGADRYVTAREGAYGDSAEGVSLGFSAINVANVPIYMDLYQTDNTVITLPNWDYLQYKIHQDAAFAVAGPESLLPQFQLGYIQAMFVLLATVCSKRSAQARYTGFTGAYTISVPSS